MRMRSFATSKCTVSMAARPSTAARMAARFARFASSAPEKPGVPRAMTSRSTAGESVMPRVWTRRMSRRPRTSGSGMATWRSKRPGRTRALSRAWGKFVEAMTMMPSPDRKPSSSTRSWLRVWRFAWKSRGFLLLPMASISSIKTMHGACAFAAANSSRTRFAPRPTHISSNSDPLVEKNGTPASPATALASSVLPVPGGPTSRTPVGSFPPSLVKSPGAFRNCTTSFSSPFASSQPFTSRKRTPFPPRPSGLNSAEAGPRKGEEDAGAAEFGGDAGESGPPPPPGKALRESSATPRKEKRTKAPATERRRCQRWAEMESSWRVT
mmetsp:Transcript_25683/g.64146  ORF Transcript_25683/g.64146 Transcript_25683/m.64146 type:complete len:325 (-) Transcript_25683:46-1020(-)